MPTPLRGRDKEVACLREQLGRLRAGRAATWLIEGGAGLGKSRMLEAVISASRAAGFAVGRGVAEPGDAAVQLAVLMDALFGGPAAPLERSSLGQSHASPEQRYWLLQDIQALLERAALRQPVVICLDDLQWADSGTLAALRSLPAQLAPLPVGWVLAFRPGGGSTDFDRTVTDLLRDGASRTSLERLDQAAVAAVAADVLGAAPDAAVLALAEGVQGNPFWLTELFCGLRDEHLVTIDAGHATLAGERLPRRVGDTMRRRLGRMSPAARNVAAVAACLGRRFTIAQLAAVLDVPASTLLYPVDQLLASRAVHRMRRPAELQPRSEPGGGPRQPAIVCRAGPGPPGRCRCCWPPARSR